MNTVWRNISLLAGCQAMLFSVNATLVSISGLAGLALAPRAALATVPTTAWLIGGVVATMPASMHMKRVGRRRGLMAGTVWGAAGVLTSAAAAWEGSFPLLCLGALLLGVFNAYGQYYRFAAADTAGVDFRPAAISMVVAGGLAGGVLGPTVSRWTVDLAGPRFAAAYLAMILFVAATGLLLRHVRIPPPAQDEHLGEPRSIAMIASEPKFIVAVLCAAIGYGVMNLIMTASPIAMQGCGHPYSDATLVISAHVVAMFAPSLFTGWLIRRIGIIAVLLLGALLQAASIGVALTGVELEHFRIALVLLGVGWNLLYIGGTTLLTEAYRPEERASAQGLNDQIVFATMAISSFSSGPVVTSAGWEQVNLVALPLVALTSAAIAWLRLRGDARRGPTPQSARPPDGR